MISKAADVASYIAEAPADRQPALKKLRALYKEQFNDCDESIDYGMPVYKRGGEMQGAFASQAQYIALYGMGKVIDQHKSELKGANCGKGCVRFKDVKKLDFALIQTMLHEAAVAKSAGC